MTALASFSNAKITATLFTDALDVRKENQNQTPIHLHNFTIAFYKNVNTMTFMTLHKIMSIIILVLLAAGLVFGFAYHFTAQPLLAQVLEIVIGIVGVGFAVWGMLG